MCFQRSVENIKPTAGQDKRKLSVDKITTYLAPVHLTDCIILTFPTTGVSVSCGGAAFRVIKLTAVTVPAADEQKKYKKMSFCW